MGRQRRARAPSRAAMIAPTTSWTGTYALPASATPVAIVVRVHGARATVSLGPGHAAATEVAVAVRGTHVRFSFPASAAERVIDGQMPLEA